MLYKMTKHHDGGFNPQRPHLLREGAFTSLEKLSLHKVVTNHIHETTNVFVGHKNQLVPAERNAIRCSSHCPCWERRCPSTWEARVIAPENSSHPSWFPSSTRCYCADTGFLPVNCFLFFFLPRWCRRDDCLSPEMSHLRSLWAAHHNWLVISQSVSQGWCTIQPGTTVFHPGDSTASPVPEQKSPFPYTINGCIPEEIP